MKSCESCSSRVEIGKNHLQLSFMRRITGIALIYLPILTLPFVFLSAYITYWHLLMMGAKQVKTLTDFLPARASHRYNLTTQITMRPSLLEYKLFWILNCSWYCPVSVALFEWHTYMVKLIENWWCPFAHEKKPRYSNALIDKSFWHIHPVNRVKLHVDDLHNPIWNDPEEP
jgi:hypothetical protein